METQLQVGSPALNRSNPKKKEPFTEDKMLPLMREHFLLSNLVNKNMLTQSNGKWLIGVQERT